MILYKMYISIVTTDFINKHLNIINRNYILVNNGRTKRGHKVF